MLVVPESVVGYHNKPAILHIIRQRKHLNINTDETFPPTITKIAEEELFDASYGTFQLQSNLRSDNCH